VTKVVPSPLFKRRGADLILDLVLLRVAPMPFHVDASRALEDEGALDDLLARIEPEDDIEVSAAHRRRVAPVLARRALRDAAEDAADGEQAGQQRS
jgi:CO/xanthine dehydrogenase FAD-binding subunit